MGYRINRQSGGQSRNLVFMGGLINDDLVQAIHINANDWNAAYRSKIIDRQCSNRSSDSEVVMGSLIGAGD